MKTIKVLASVCIIFGLSINNSFAQNGEKVDVSYTWEATNLSIPCVEESLSGSFWVSAYWINGNYFEDAKGVIYGDITHKEYTLSWNCHYMGHGSIHAWTMGFQWPLTLWLDGKLLGAFYQSYKGTFNNDNTIVDRYVIGAECAGQGKNK